MDKLEPPSSLIFDGNVAEQWKLWRQELELYLTATESDEKDDKVKTSILLTCIGKKGREIYNTFTFTEEGDKFDFDVVLEKFQEYCNPRANITFLRHRFFTCKQSDGQGFEEFITELKKRSAECEFETLRDSLIKDIAICSLADNRLRERLLREPNFTLDKAIEYGQASQETKRHLSEMQRETNTVDYVAKTARKRTTSPRRRNSNKSENMIVNCKFCGGQHASGNCPAYNKQCNNCSKLNHFAKCCNKKKTRKVGEVNAETSDEDEFFVGAVGAESDASLGSNKTAELKQESSKDYVVGGVATTSDWSISLSTNGSDVLYKLDTGAQVNILPKSEYVNLANKPKLKDTKIKLTAYNSTKIPVLGKCILRVLHKGKMVPIMFIVTETDSMAILGLGTCEKLNLVKRTMLVNKENPDIMQEFSDCFGEISDFMDTSAIMEWTRWRPHCTHRIKGADYEPLYTSSRAVIQSIF